MSGSFPPLPELRPFQAPNLVAMSNAMQEQSLNALREQQLMGDEREKNAMRALFSDPNFNPSDPAQARRILEVAPRSGPATYSALLRGYADQRAAEASARTGAAAGRQAELANIQIEQQKFNVSRQELIGLADLPEGERQAAWSAWRERTMARMPYARNIPREYSPNAYASMLSTASEIASRIASSNPRDPTRETKIRDIMATFDVDRRVALGIVDNTIRVATDPVTGQHTLIDTITGQSRPLVPAAPAPAAPAPAAPAPAAPAPAAPAPAAPVAVPLVVGPRAGLTPPAAAAPLPAAPPPPAPPPPTAPPQTLYELAAKPRTTGLTPVVQQLGQNVLGQIGANIIDPELTERRQAFDTAQGELVRALAVNPRFPVDEMRRIREELNIRPGAFTDPQSLLARMRSIDTSLRERLVNEERAGADASLPVETRRNALRAAEDIRNFLARLGVPQGQAPAPAPTPPPRRGNALNRRTQAGAPQRLRYNPETGALEPAQ